MADVAALCQVAVGTPPPLPPPAGAWSWTPGAALMSSLQKGIEICKQAIEKDTAQEWTGLDGAIALYLQGLEHLSTALMRVKFKEEQPLASLDGGKNSGGEKTNTYILYMDPRC